MTAKNILFTYITPFHPDKGGIGRVTHTLTKEFQKRGHAVFFLIYSCSITIKHQFDYPAPLEYFPSSDLLSQENIDFYHHFLEVKKIDVVINQSGNFSDSFLYLNKGKSKAKIISVLHSAPSVGYKHLWADIYPLRNSSFTEKGKRIARVFLYPHLKRKYDSDRKSHFQRLLPLTDLVCTLSGTFFNEISSYCNNYKDKYIAIPNPNSFSHQQLKSISGIKKKKQILSVSLLTPNKRVDRIIDIWRKVYRDYPDWNLVIVGEGSPSYVNYLKHLAENLKNISFEGFQAPLFYYAESSILCFTSNYEGWGMVLTEAMQCGTVPMSFDSFASVTDIIKNEEDGIIIPSFDMIIYEQQLRILMSDQNKLSIISQNAAKNVEKFSIQTIADLWEQYL